MHHDGFSTGWPELAQRLFFTQQAGFWFVDYFGDSEEFFPELLTLLAAPELAETLRWLSLRSPDEGANGTREWDFTPLLETKTQFPCLQSLQIARTPPENHNHFIVGRGYEESGQLGALLDRMPALIELWSPSAPDATFCERASHPLRLLHLDCGYDHQDFIAQLAQSRCFSQLLHVEFSDYAQFYMPNWEASCVPFEHYEQLLSSNTLPALSRFFLRSAGLSEAQVAHLKTQRPGLRFTYQNPRII